MTSRISHRDPAGGPDEAFANRSPAGTDRWFSLFWPLSVLLHLAANGGHLLPLDGIGVLQIFMAGLAVLALVRPQPLAIASLAVTYLLVLGWKLPVVGNHEILLGLVGLIVVIAIPLAKRRGEWWVSVAAPAVRLVLVVGYGFIAFSKLNTGFVDLAVSCAVIFGDDLLGPFGPGAEHLGVPAWPVVGFTAGIELAIPVLLVFRRTRAVGVMVALGFHFLLALDPVSHVWDFSATLLPMFCLFGTRDLRASLDRLADGVGGLARRELTLGLATVAALHGCVLIVNSRLEVASVLRPLFGPWLIAYPIWLLTGGFVLTLAVRSGLGHRGEEPPPESVGGYTVGWKPAAPFVVVVALAVLNGLGPYFEYRSAAAFNMYANLEINDGRSNHLLIGGIVDQPDEPSMVQIHAAAPSSSLEYYLTNQQLLPAENLDRYLRDHLDENPTISRGDGLAVRARSLGFGETQPSGLTGQVTDVLQYKLGFRRAIDATGAHRCQRVWGPLG